MALLGRVHKEQRPSNLHALLSFMVIVSVSTQITVDDQEVFVSTGEEFFAALKGAVSLPLHIRLAPGATISVGKTSSLLPRTWRNGTLRISSNVENPAVLSLGWRSEVTVSK